MYYKNCENFINKNEDDKKGQLYVFFLDLRKVLYNIYGVHTILLRRKERHSYITYDKYYSIYVNDDRVNRCPKTLAACPL